MKNRLYSLLILAFLVGSFASCEKEQINQISNHDAQDEPHDLDKNTVIFDLKDEETAKRLKEMSHEMRTMIESDLLKAQNGKVLEQNTSLQRIPTPGDGNNVICDHNGNSSLDMYINPVPNRSSYFRGWAGSVGPCSINYKVKLEAFVYRTGYGWRWLNQRNSRPNNFFYRTFMKTSSDVQYYAILYYDGLNGPGYHPIASRWFNA